MKNYLITLLVLFIIISLHPVFAVDSNIENIIVSATRSDSYTDRLPGNITVITAEDIEISGATHLVDVLRSYGGMQISDLYGDGTDASVGLRGFSSTAQQNTLIMIDGRRLNNADNGLPDLNTVALKSVKQIEIIKSSMGALYGDKAVGGVINITREPESFAAEINTEFGSYSNRSGFVSIENRHGNGVIYRIGGLRKLNGNYRDNNKLQFTDITVMAGIKHKTGKLFFEFQDLNEDILVPGPLFDDLRRSNRKQALNTGDFIDTDTRLYRVGVKHGLSRNFTMFGEYTSRHNDIQGQLSSGGVPSRFLSERRHIGFTPRVIGRFETLTGQIFVTVGADLFQTDYLISSDFGITDDTQSQISIYAQVIAPITERFNITAGLRHSKVKNDIFVDTIAFGRSLPEGTEIDDSANAWEMGISYDINPNWRLFAKLDRNFRFVTADEYSAVADSNFFSTLFSFGSVIPLPQTQTGFSYEVGGEWTLRNNRISVQGFQMEIDNEIVFDPVLFLNTNIGDTRRRGFIFESEYMFSDTLNFSVQYSYLDSSVTSGVFEGSDLTFISKNTASFRAQYRHDENFSGYLELYGVSGRILGGDFANTFSSLPGYVVSNMNLSYKFNSISLSLRVNNLLDKTYSDSGSLGNDFRVPFPSPRVETFFPAPKRNFQLSLEYHYQ